MGKSELPAVDCREYALQHTHHLLTQALLVFTTVEKGKTSDYDDAGSVSSATTAYTMMGEEVIDAEADAFSQAIDDTYESRYTKCSFAIHPFVASSACHKVTVPHCCRASTREKAWERMVTLLRNNVRIDDCYQRYDTNTVDLHMICRVHCGIFYPRVQCYSMALGNLVTAKA